MNEPKKYASPPRWADRLLEWFCAPHLLEEVQGDLHERFCKQIKEVGERKAKKAYICQVLGFIKPFAFKHKSDSMAKPIYTDMFKNYFTIAFRNLLRQKAFSFINISGLAVGMACSILILLWVQDELSYDRFHAQANNLYRITVEISGTKAAITCPPLAPIIKAQMPEVQDAIRMYPTQHLFEVNNQKFEEVNGFYVDASFLNMFSFPLVAGEATTALLPPDAIIITNVLAEKYFRQENPLGKTIQLDNQHHFTVTGVLNVPHHSHLQFNYLLPISFLGNNGEDLNWWGSFQYYTYIQLKGNAPNTNARLQKVTKQINQIFVTHDKEDQATFSLQPLTDIYLRSDLLGDFPRRGDIQYVRIFSVVAICILVIACINFMNLATARSARRAKEVGLRKVIGATRKQLIIQFLGESLLVSIIALLVAILIVSLSLPAIHTLFDKELNVDFFQTHILLGLLSIAVLTGVLAGIYPALFLSHFQPVRVLKGVLTCDRTNVLLRNGLVVTQFVISMVLIVGTMVVYRQLQYIQTKNLGFDKENLIYVPMKGDLWKHYQALQTQLNQHLLTSNFTVISELPVNNSGGSDVSWAGKNPKEQVLFSSMDVDENFFQVFQTELISGRRFSSTFKQDTTSYIVNETALKIMGMDPVSAIGKSFACGPDGTIIGVVKDFNYKPLRQRIEPLVLALNRGRGVLVVRTQPDEVNATVEVLEEIFRKLNPGYPFSYNFVDQDLADLYKHEQRMGYIANTFAILAIFISCLGLYGLAAYTAEQRSKEMSIRKVLGASVQHLTLLLSKDFVKLVLIAFCVATPIAWYAMYKWLENFAYHIHISPWMFALAGILALCIALFTVSGQAIKAALTNPVKSLRNE